MRLDVKLTGFSQVGNRLDRLAAGAWKSGLMAMVGGLVKRQTETRIRSEKTDPAGAAWAALAASTLRRKRKGGSILVESGRLLGSIEASSTSNSARIGTAVFYGAFHQDGTDRMPARPFLGLSDPNEAELRTAVESFVASRLGL